MSKKAYLILFDNGDCDIYPSAVCVSFDKEKADAEVLRLKEKEAKAQSALELKIEFRNFIGNEIPFEGRRTYPEKKKWPAGLSQMDITDEMHKEREEWEAECKRLKDEEKIAWYKYRETIDDIIDQFVASLDEEDQRLIEETESRLCLNPEGFYVKEVDILS